MSQKMVIEAKRKEMERFKRMKVYRVVTRESMERDEEVKMVSIKWSSRTEERNNIPLPRLVWQHASSTPETSVVSCLQEHQV